jgi:hypothetical protein
MSVAPSDPDQPSTARPRLRVVPAAARAVRAALPALAEEPGWWAAAPLGADGRDLRALPCAALAALTGHYLPFTLRALGRYHGVLVASLGDADDIAGQAGEWLLAAIRCYDPARGVPFAGYVAALVPYWVQSAARAGVPRYVAESERGCARAVERSLAERHRPPTLAELARELGEDEAAAGERVRAVAVRRALRNPVPLDGVDVPPAADDTTAWTWHPGENGADADARLLAVEERRQLTAALLMAACDDEPEVNARGVWTLLLEQYGGYTRADLAAVGRCSKKPFLAAQQRLVAGARQRLAAS